MAYRESLSHVRVAHLTDQHFGRVTPYAAQREAVAMANAQKPDLIAITGDFVAHSLHFLDQLESVIARLEAPVVCVLGNHDHWSGPDEVRRALRRAGAEVLDNRHTTLTIRGQRLQVVGLDDAYTGHARRDEAVRGLDPRLPSLGLSHIGEEADGLWRHGVSLVLAGHTHAGQLTVARLHEIAVGRIAGHKYVHGMYGCRRHQHAQGAVYVGAGIGAAVIPWRLGERAKREVTIFELGHEPGSFAEHHQDQRPLPGRAPTEKTRARRAAKVIGKALRRTRRTR
jgi:predicted MPP superfamily phosphohydrolase